MSSQGLLITGTIGTGKTAVAADLVELLQQRGVLAAAIDLDWLCWAHVDRSDQQRLMVENLRAVMHNFRAANVDHYVLARLVMSGDQVDDIRSLFDDFRVVRLVAPPDIAESRIRARDAGSVMDQHLSEIVEFDRALDAIGVEDFRVENGDRAIRSVSEELAAKLGW